MLHCIVTRLWAVKGRPNSIQTSLIQRWRPPNLINFSDFWKPSTWLKSNETTPNLVNRLILMWSFLWWAPILIKSKFKNSSPVSIWTSERAIGKVCQTLETVFHHISKHLEYSAAHRTFNSLLGVWKSDETLSLFLKYYVNRMQLPITLLHPTWLINSFIG